MCDKGTIANKGLSSNCVVVQGFDNLSEDEQMALAIQMSLQPPGTYTYMYVHTYLRARTYMCIRVLRSFVPYLYTYTYVCMYVYMCMYVLYVRMYID